MGKVQEHKRAAKARKQIDITREKSDKADRFEIMGSVEDCLPNTMFRIKVLESDYPQMIDKILLATLAGKMRLHRIRVMPGDIVKGYVSKYDLSKCKITYRTVSRQN